VDRGIKTVIAILIVTLWGVLSYFIFWNKGFHVPYGVPTLVMIIDFILVLTGLILLGARVAGAVGIRDTFFYILIGCFNVYFGGMELFNIFAAKRFKFDWPLALTLSLLIGLVILIDAWSSD
jgi:hypothetical protein